MELNDSVNDGESCRCFWVKRRHTSIPLISINRFDIMGSGISYKEQYVLTTTADGAGSPGAYDFLGLAGFDVEKEYI